MKVKITDVGGPFWFLEPAEQRRNVGFNVSFEYPGGRASAFVGPGDNLKLALLESVKSEEGRKSAIAEAEKLVIEAKGLIGLEIELP